jgi:hypothetical protein
MFTIGLPERLENILKHYHILKNNPNITNIRSSPYVYCFITIWHYTYS